MKIPRDVDAGKLIKLLERYGYAVIRQTGSHIRLSKHFKGKEHTITIPNHRPIKIGTLQGIVKDICMFNGMDTTEIYKQL